MWVSTIQRIRFQTVNWPSTLSHEFSKIRFHHTKPEPCFLINTDQEFLSYSNLILRSIFDWCGCIYSLTSSDVTLIHDFRLLAFASPVSWFWRAIAARKMFIIRSNHEMKKLTYTGRWSPDFFQELLSLLRMTMTRHNIVFVTFEY